MKGVWSRIAALVILIIAISYLQSIPPTTHASLLSTYDQDDPVTAIIPSASENLEFKRHIPQNILDYHVEGSLRPIDVYFEPFISGAKSIEIWVGDEIGFITIEKTALYKSEGTIFWRGTIKNSASGAGFSIYKRKDGYGLTGGFNIGRRHFGIEIEKNTSQQYIWETDPSVLKRIVDPPSDSIQKKILRRMKKYDSYKSKYRIPKSATIPPQETPIIDVLILYSKKLDVKYADIEARIDRLISTANQALTSSNANAELHLVGSMLAGYEDAACTNDGLGQALSDLTCNVGAFYGVPIMRDILAADLVIWLQDAIIADGQTHITLGKSWNPDTPTPPDYFGHAVVVLFQDEEYYKCIFVHEIGHLFSLDHDYDDLLDQDPDNDKDRAYIYGNGHYFGPYVEDPPQPKDDHTMDWGTIMSLVLSDRMILRFSNPNQSYEIPGFGTYTTGHSDYAKAYQAISEIAHHISCYRTEQPPTEFRYYPVNDDTGKNSYAFAFITPDKVAGSSATLIICDPEYDDPFAYIPNAAYLTYGHTTTPHIVSSNDEGRTYIDGSAYVGELPGVIIGNSQGAISTSEVMGTASAFTAIINFKDNFTGNKRILGRYWDESYHYVRKNFGLFDITNDDMWPSVSVILPQIINYDDDTNLLTMTLKISDNNSSTDIKEIYIYVTEMEINPFDEDIIQDTPDYATLIRVTPYMKKSTKGYNKISMLYWISLSNYFWQSDKKIGIDELWNGKGMAVLDNSRSTINYVGSEVTFKTRIGYFRGSSGGYFEGYKRIYLRAIDYQNNDTKYIQIGDVVIQ